jgi:putative ABC transport system permease protein
MYIIDVARRSGRSLLSAKTRTILTAFAIAVGTFALTLTLGASNGAQGYADSIIRDNFDPSELIVTNDDSVFNRTDTSKPQVYDPSFGSVTSQAGATTQVRRLADSDLTRLKNISGVASVRPAVSVSLQYITRDGYKKYVGTVQAYNTYKNPDLLAGSIPAAIPDKSLILPEAFLAPLGFDNAQQAIGQTVRLAVRKQVDQSTVLSSLAQGGLSAAANQLSAANQPAEEKFSISAVTKKPSAVVQPGTELYMYTSSSEAIRLNDITTQGTADYHKYLTAYVKVTNGTDEKNLQAAQDKIQKAGYAAQSVKDTEKILTQIITVLQGIVSVFGLIAVVASVFGVVNTMYISVLQRTREIGLMKALGMHKKDITRLFRLEAAFIGLLGGALGSAIAVGAGTLLNPWISTKLGLGGQHLLDFKLGQIALLILALMAIATVAGLLPARKASRLDPIEALRTE